MADPTSTGADVSSNALLTAWDSYRAVAAAGLDAARFVFGADIRVFAVTRSRKRLAHWTVGPVRRSGLWYGPGSGCGFPPGSANRKMLRCTVNHCL